MPRESWPPCGQEESEPEAEDDSAADEPADDLDPVPEKVEA